MILRFGFGSRSGLDVDLDVDLDLESKFVLGSDLEFDWMRFGSCLEEI